MRPDAPCAGGCGKLLYLGTGSLPSGLATCQTCRRAGRAPQAAYRFRGEGSRVASAATLPCPVCGEPFRPKRTNRATGHVETCGRSCGRTLGNWRRYGSDTSLDRDGARASRRAKDRARCAARRARLRFDFVEMVDPIRVFDRDGWRCHLCHRKVDKRLDGRHRMGPTLDHLIPIADGGEHSYANTALAHRACNSRKGVKAANTQLALVG
jgi:5-methylcytosine-specific restriction endonuclease McrA